MREVSSPVAGMLLGLLLRRSSYGYELARRVEERLGAAWRLTPSSIYPVLDRLESTRLIRRAVKDLPARSRQRERVLYEPTDEAPLAFERWMARRVRREPIRTELLAKLAVARPQDGERLLAALDEYEGACVELFEQVSAGEHPVARWEGLLSELIGSAAEQQLRAELAWVALARRRLRAFVGEPGGHGAA